MRRFLGALRFMTSLPLGRGGADSFQPQGMGPYFPLVGIGLGLILALADGLFLTLWSGPVAAWLDVVLLILLTGALHLDGLGDAADGLFSHRGRAEALEIMKDTRVGVMGLVAVIAVLGIKWGGILGLEQGRWLALILVPGYSRSSLLLAMRFLPYGRPEGGLGSEFCRIGPGWRSFWGLGLLVACSLFLGWGALVLNAAFAGLTFLILWFYARRIGCITGDTLGAMNEVLEAGLFLALAAV
ncbi:MAG: adenosylcobinamide-GDP ribazoletransferase [Desulfohalobiaceae bacterium]|nr:adenosylcobinamide-GDP ribazoletransferase [Desulfohalobiaceae bacterium]